MKAGGTSLDRRLRRGGGGAEELQQWAGQRRGGGDGGRGTGEGGGGGGGPAVLAYGLNSCTWCLWRKWGGRRERGGRRGGVLSCAAFVHMSCTAPLCLPCSVLSREDPPLQCPTVHYPKITLLPGLLSSAPRRTTACSWRPSPWPSGVGRSLSSSPQPPSPPPTTRGPGRRHWLRPASRWWAAAAMPMMRRG